jgi:hypothetical protein
MCAYLLAFCVAAWTFGARLADKAGVKTQQIKRAQIPVSLSGTKAVR